MRQLSILITALAVLVLSACSITNQVHFNKDYSGNYAMIVDLGDAMEMFKSFDPSIEDSLQTQGAEDPLGGLISTEDRMKFDSMFATMDGISNANYDVGEDYVVTMSFDFEDIDALNNLFEKWASDAADAASSQPEMAGLGGLGSMAAPSFTRDGKTITHMAEMPLDPEDLGGEVEGMDEMDMSSMLDGFAGMMDYQVVMTFDRKIKSVGGEGFDILSQEKKSLKTRVDMGHLMDSGSYKIAVQLK